MFTWWNNSHRSKNYIRERLDRAVVDASWCDRFPNFRVINGDPHHSDHRPVIVEWGEAVDKSQKPSGHLFRIEAGWVQEDNCRTIVQNAWNLTMEVRAGKVVEAVREVGADLWDWSRNVLGDLEKRIKWVKKKLEECRRREICAQKLAREEILKYKLEKLEAQKELYWRQRAQSH